METVVYIKRIDVRGFKTFRRKISIDLEPGLTVVTGPNGSGKSNIMDAVKFALGELSPKELRGGAFEDLISKSSMDSAKSAYVALRFDNRDRRIPIDSDYVTISREFIRGGEGIYRINGRRVSRRQINDALSSAGLTLSGLNIVPQHTVTRLADTTPEERRKIIENMIGIGIYDSKKAEALTQLQQADINVKIASARVEEVKRRVTSLEEERNKLLRSRVICNELRSLKAQITSMKIHRLEIESNELAKYRDELSEKIGELKKRRSLLHEELEHLNTERNRLETEISEKEAHSLQEVNERLREALALKAELSAKMEAVHRTIEYLTGQQQGLSSEVSAFEEEISRIDERVKVVQGIRDELIDKQRELEDKRSEILLKLSKLTGDYSGRLPEIESLNRRIDEVTKRLTVEESNLKNLWYRMQILSSEADRLEAHRETLKKALEEVSRKISEKYDTIKARDIRLREISTEATELERLKDRKRRILDRALNVAEKARKALAGQEGTPQSETEAAIQLVEAAAAGSLKGIIGRLRDHIDIPEPYISALESASEGWLDAIVTESLEDSLNCFKLAKRLGLSPVKVIPLSEVSRVKELEAPQGAEAVKAVDLVEVPSRLRPALLYVLGDTLVTESRKEAFLLSLQGVRAVSIQGDLFKPDGGFKTGDYRSPREWLPETMSLRSLVEKLESSIEKCREELNSIEGGAEALRLEAIKLEGELSVRNREIESLKDEKRKISGELTDLEASIKEVYRDRELYGEEADKTALKVEGLKRELDNLTMERDSLIDRIQSSPIEDSGAEMSRLEGELGEVREALVKAEAELSSLKSSREAISGNIKRILEREAEIEDRIGQERLSAKRLEEDAEANLRELQGLEDLMSRVSSSMDRLRGELRGIEEKISAATSELECIYGEYDKASSKYEELSSSLRNMEVEKAVLLRDLHALGYEFPQRLEYSESDIEDLRRPLEEELEGIGAVNELASQQYREYASNYKGLSLRINELEAERITIIRFMDELEGRKRDSFMQAFRIIDKAFRSIFSKLSGGGSGRLLLENQDNPFEGGLEVILAFPGKAEFSISGASGGEKSVATVCFILALQDINPMPFYMFDEIDAHLDAWNSQRLAELLKERSKGSQFIVISLKDSTVAKADSVYGVYIEKGYSRIVPLPRGKVAA
ncbi:MAG: chromosome segregation SMC family protein [Candidatus Bathyarchaeia archaeon]